MHIHSSELVPIFLIFQRSLLYLVILIFHLSKYCFQQLSTSHDPPSIHVMITETKLHYYCKETLTWTPYIVRGVKDILASTEPCRYTIWWVVRVHIDHVWYRVWWVILVHINHVGAIFDGSLWNIQTMKVQGVMVVLVPLGSLPYDYFWSTPEYYYLSCIQCLCGGWCFWSWTIETFKKVNISFNTQTDKCIDTFMFTPLTCAGRTLGFVLATDNGCQRQ